jgi:hypothetical protein
MKTRLLVLFFVLCVLAGGCSKPQADPVEEAFKRKFEALRLGITQAEVRNSLGEPSRTQSQIEEEDETIETGSGPIQIRKGDSTKVWLYTFGRKDYTLWFATKNTNDTSTGVLFMQNVISVGHATRIK